MTTGSGMADTTISTWSSIVARISVWVRRRHRKLSARVFAADDGRARDHGWEVTESTGRFGCGERSYRDPRFNDRRRQRSHGVAYVAGREHSQVSSKNEVKR
jgi:hypothetical protein